MSKKHLMLDRYNMINNLLRAYYLEVVDLAQSNPSIFSDGKFAQDDPSGFARKQTAEYKIALQDKTTPELSAIYKDYLKDLEA